MTGDIKNLLLSSEATASLRMEARIAQAFTQLGWEVERSPYYSDPETGKAREIDVRASKLIKRSRRREGVGAPIIKFEVICECKSLSGTNLIFEASHEPEKKRGMQNYWLGSEIELRPLVSAIARDAKIEEPARLQALYKYVVDRAYANEGRALLHPVVIPTPPIELVSRAYRETKSGKMTDENVEGKKINPCWSAIQSTLSATRAVEMRTRNAVLSYLNTDDIEFNGIDAFAKSAAFFLDVELMRFVFFHPFIVLNAKLWQLKEDDLREVQSVRLLMTDIGWQSVYIDLVSEQKSDEYLKNLTEHFAATAKRSLSKLSQILGMIEWEPGQAETILAKVIQPSHRNSNKTPFRSR